MDLKKLEQLVKKQPKEKESHTRLKLLPFFFILTDYLEGVFPNFYNT